MSSWAAIGPRPGCSVVQQIQSLGLETWITWTWDDSQGNLKGFSEIDDCYRPSITLQIETE